MGYNQVHYESLVPVTEEDIEKTKILVTNKINGNYTFSKKDIPRLISTLHENNADYELEFPPLRPNYMQNKLSNKNVVTI